MARVRIRGEMLRWARERARISTAALEARFPRLSEWETGELQPTFKQLEAFAKATYAPMGYLFLAQPPEEVVPIPDFRTLAGREITHPSPNLLDTIYACQERQDWYRDYRAGNGDEPLEFVGSATIQSNVVETAGTLRGLLAFDLNARQECPTWADALRLFIKQADELGILVMCSGVVLNNNRRSLDPEEFRGFALADDLAPLVFINGADTKSAQMFTLAHELAHIMLGISALSDSTVASLGANHIERWCNRVAAELLAPIAAFTAALLPNEALEQTLRRLARRFKVSTLVVLQRLRDAGQFTPQEFQDAYEAELDRLRQMPKGAGGGDFYLTAAARSSRRFTRALVVSTLEGHTLYRDAFRLLGISKSNTFHELGRKLGVHD